MTNTKRTWSTEDAAPIVLHALRSRDSDVAYPLIDDGMKIPAHDQQVIDESDANNITITYKLDGVTVATKTIVIDGTTTTITLT